MRLVFGGTSDFAVPSLEALLAEGFDIAAVVTQADSTAGRGRTLREPPIKLAAKRHNLSIFQPEKISAPESVSQLTSLGDVDFFVVVAYGQKIPKVLLEWPKGGVINVHGSILPRYRGASPIQQAIIDGLTETGVTTMMMAEGWDTGDILLQESTPIEGSDNYATLSDKLSIIGAKLLVQTIYGLADRSIQPIPQDDSLATYACSLKKESGYIKWDTDAAAVANLVRGCTPRPGAFTSFGGSMLKVWEASIINTQPVAGAQAGEILQIESTGVSVACASGVVLLKEVQPASRRRMPAADWARGSKAEAGKVFDDLFVI